MQFHLVLLILYAKLYVLRSSAILVRTYEYCTLPVGLVELALLADTGYGYCVLYRVVVLVPIDCTDYGKDRRILIVPW